MTDDERAVLDGRLLAAELAVQALLTIIVQHLSEQRATKDSAIKGFIQAFSC